jgi:hypothetical protein
MHVDTLEKDYRRLGTLAAVAAKANCSPEWVRRLLLRNGVTLHRSGARLGNQQHRTRYVDQRYFSSLHGTRRPYFLGLLAADGSVSKRGEVCLGLQERDAVLVRTFKQELKAAHPLSRIKRRGRRTFVKLSFSCKKMVSDLERYGIRSNKTKAFSFPALPKRALPHFVRGYFDGDGCAYYSRGIKLANFCGTRSFLRGLWKVLKSEAGVQGGSLRPHASIFRLFLGKHDAERVAAWLYKRSDIALERKKVILCA